MLQLFSCQYISLCSINILKAGPKPPSPSLLSGEKLPVTAFNSRDSKNFSSMEHVFSCPFLLEVAGFDKLVADLESNIFLNFFLPKIPDVNQYKQEVY